MDAYNVLNGFLLDHKVEGKNVTYTHTCFGPPWGKYNIPDDDYDEFISYYTNTLVTTNRNLHITEKPKEVAPLCIDVDWKFSKEGQKRMYTADDIKNILKGIKHILKQLFVIKKKHLKAFVFEKEEPTEAKKNSVYKDGIHIIYPFLPLNTVMRYLITTEISNYTVENNTFKNIPFTNPVDDIFDTAVVSRNGWMMYGSVKHKGNPYFLTHIYNHSIKEIDVNSFEHHELPNMLNVRQYDNDDSLEFKNPEDTELVEKLKMIDSKFINKSKKKDKLIPEKNYEFTTNIDVKLTEDGEKAVKLLYILDKKRAIQTQLWFELCWTLHNIDSNLYLHFVEFSKKGGPRFSLEGCNEYWEKAKIWKQKNRDRKGLGLASLERWAMEDNSDKYLEIKKDEIMPHLLNAETATHYDVATAIYNSYRFTYVCSGIKSDIWYEYQNHKWVQIEAGFTLYRKISKDFINKILNLVSWFVNQTTVASGQDRDKFFTKAEKMTKLVTRLKDTTFKTKVMSECRSLFHIQNFEQDYLDNNRDLIGFENGVYDLEKGYFRPGSPEDYISLTTGYDYKEYDINDPVMEDIMDYFRKVQVDDDMRKYLLTLMASFLDGHIRQQKFIMWTGSGSNSKSMAVNFLQRAMGDYSDVLPPTIFTMKRKSSSNATPELANKKGKRFIVLQEPEEDDKIQVGVMKEYTGGDKIHARALHQAPIVYHPQFKIILVCNKLPNISATDGGTWRRVRVTPWESEFLELDQKIVNPKKQFYKDYGLEDRMKEWKEAFIWLLLNKYYKEYRENDYKINEPAKVTEFTDKYKKESDMFYEFFQTKTERTNNNNDNVNINSLYDSFKEFYEDSYGSQNCPRKKELIKNLEKQNLRIRGIYVYGLLYTGGDEEQDLLNNLYT